jgi:hypothetical protein
VFEADPAADALEELIKDTIANVIDNDAYVVT